MRNTLGKSRAITWMLYPLTLAFAVFTTMQGVLLPVLREEFHITLAQGGILSVLVQVGSIAGLLLGGVLLDRYGKLRVIIAGDIVFALTLLCVGVTGMGGVADTGGVAAAYIAYLALIALISGAGKFSDSGNSSAVSELNPDRRGFFLGLLHCAYAIGSFAGPVLVSSLLTGGVAWRQTYVILGLAELALVACFLCATRGSGALKREKRAPVATASLKAVMRPEMVVLIMVMAFYGGHQQSLNAWLPTYFQERLGLAPVPASLGLSMFWIGLIVSRLCGSFVSQRVHPRVLVRLGLGAACAFMALGTLLGQAWAMYAGVFGAGLCSGWTVPMVLTIAYEHFPDAQGKATMLLFLAVSVGAMAVSWLMGVVSEYVGLVWAMYLNALALGIACVFACRTREPVRA